MLMIILFSVRKQQCDYVDTHHFRYYSKGKKPRLKPHPKYPLKVHVWVGINTTGATDVCTFSLYCKILQRTLVPLLGKKFHLPPHTSSFKTIAQNMFLEWLKLSIWKKGLTGSKCHRNTWYKSHWKCLGWTQRIHMVWSEAYYCTKDQLVEDICQFCLP